MAWLTDILLGALSGGVNTPTIVVLNLSLLGCAALITSLVFATDTPPDVVPHLVVVLFFACGLLGSVNWLVAQTGVVSAADQQADLFVPAAKDSLAEIQEADPLEKKTS